MIKTLAKVAFWGIIGVTTGMIGIGALALLAESEQGLE